MLLFILPQIWTQPLAPPLPWWRSQTDEDLYIVPSDKKGYLKFMHTFICIACWAFSQRMNNYHLISAWYQLLSYRPFYLKKAHGISHYIILIEMKILFCNNLLHKSRYQTLLLLLTGPPAIILICCIHTMHILTDLLYIKKATSRILA